MSLRENESARSIARAALVSGAGAAYDSATIAGLVAHGGVAAGGGTLGALGAEAVTKIFGEDVGKEVRF